MSLQRVNLIPVKERARAGWWSAAGPRRPWALIGAGLVMAVIVWQGTAPWRLRYALKRQQARIRQLQQDVRTQNTQAALVRKAKDDVHRQRREVEQRLALLQEISRPGRAWSAALAELSHLVPDDLWVSKAVLKADGVLLRGTTADNAVVSRFMVALDQSAAFQDTAFTYTQKAMVEKKPVTEFEITSRYVE